MKIFIYTNISKISLEKVQRSINLDSRNGKSRTSLPGSCQSII
ncbi:hypothetical protein [Pontibacter mucosus]|nr:hypothetical protein [Pontibacter mucosus]